MWTSKNRRRYDCSKLRYPSDLTDDEWKLVEHLIPPGKPSLNWLSVARGPERLAAEKHGLRIFRSVDL
jgi:hypothetical protein